MSILFINACVRKNSRTLALAKSIIKDVQDDIIELNLNTENIPPLNRELLKSERAYLVVKIPMTLCSDMQSSLQRRME